MPTVDVLLIDPFYNPSTVPPNWSLGLIEKKLNKAGLSTMVLDFVDRTCEGKDLAYFLKQENFFIQTIKKEAENAEYVYITSSYGIPLKQKPVFPRIVKICEEIKKINPNIKISVGGSTVNYAKKMLNISSFNKIDCGLVDKYIFGDETAFVEYLFNAKNIPLDQMLNNEIIEWNSWDFNKYPNYLSFLTARGCIYDCSFCFESKIFDRRYESIAINSVLEDIKLNVSKRNINKYAIEDSTFLSNPDVEKYCDEIIKQKIKIQWSAYSRIDQILKYKNLLPKIKSAGCTSFIVGIESPSDKVLKKVNKYCTSSDADKTVRLLKQNYIGVQGSFMLGFPGDTYEDIKKTIDYGLNLNLFAYRWHIYQPSFLDKTQSYIGGVKPQPLDYLRIQTNIPDSCIPEVLRKSDIPIALLTEEHFLIRAIPYLNENEYVLQKFGYNDFIFSKIFKIAKSKLINKSPTFNEEEMYNLI